MATKAVQRCACAQACAFNLVYKLHALLGLKLRGFPYLVRFQTDSHWEMTSALLNLANGIYCTRVLKRIIFCFFVVVWNIALGSDATSLQIQNIICTRSPLITNMRV